MEFKNKDLEQIQKRKVDFIRKYGPHDIVHDIDYLLDEMGRYRRKEVEDGWHDTQSKLVIAAMRHLSTVHSGKEYSPTTCSQCEQARSVMMDMRAGKI